MSYPPANRDVAGYDLSLLYTVSDPFVGNTHPRDPLSAAAPLSSGPPQPQLYATEVEKPHYSSTVGYGPGVVSYTRKEELASKGHEHVVARAPWYRTRRGITIVIVAIVVVAAAAVGGAVGGTHHSSKPKSNAGGQQNTGSGNTTTTQQGQGTNAVGGNTVPTHSILPTTPIPAGTNLASSTAPSTGATVLSPIA